MLKLYVVDGKGRKFNVNEVASFLSITYSRVRHAILTHKAKTLSDVLRITKEIDAKAGRRPMKQIETTLGTFNIDELYEKFEYKNDLKKSSFRRRIEKHGGMSYKIWLSKSEYKKYITNKTKTCNTCGASKKVFAFEKVTYGDGRAAKCTRCKTKARAKRIKENPLSPTKNTYIAEKDSIILFNGKRYVVGELLDEGRETDTIRKGNKSYITGYRIMKNGQVLKRSPVFIGQRWERV